MPLKYIVVQAGGRGSRMEVLTRNKPKALVSVNNLPIIFHLFKNYPDKKYFIIGDYKIDVLEKYLAAFAEVDFRVISARSGKGTCAGLSEAISYIPDNERFMLIWCDLVLPKDFQIPDKCVNYVGVAKDFPCRWKYEEGSFSEEKSSTQGVAGLFIFNEKSEIWDVPSDGEFVRWLKDKDMYFNELPLYQTKEYGLYSEWKKLPVMRCRPFNRIEIRGDRLIKHPVDQKGCVLAEKECAWYQKLSQKGFKSIPVIYSYDPLEMELVHGRSIYEYKELGNEKKKKILEKIVTCLKDVHSMESVAFDVDSYKNAYIGKTFERLEKVRDLIPFAKESTVWINGKECRNIFYNKKRVKELISSYEPDSFCLIHGDCTFSNIMLRDDEEPVLIDPRGYFGHTLYYGDAAYDWGKLYYSFVTNYGCFNLKHFDLDIFDDGVTIHTESNGWEELEDYFFKLLDGEVSKRQMKLLVAIIWLSFTTYAWDDYDSICGAFYKGLYYLEEAFEMESAYVYFEKMRAISRGHYNLYPYP